VIWMVAWRAVGRDGWGLYCEGRDDIVLLMVVLRSRLWGSVARLVVFIVTQARYVFPK
jgi:hypothetical protein